MVRAELERRERCARRGAGSEPQHLCPGRRTSGVLCTEIVGQGMICASAILRAPSPFSPVLL